MANDTDRMTVSGFVAAPDPYELIGIEGVRYIGLTQGPPTPYGLAAFDMDRADVVQLPHVGRVLTVVEPSPDYPDTWPEWTRPKGPKRQIATGDERFILYPVPVRDMSAFDAARIMDEELSPRGIAVVFDGIDQELQILVETGPEWACTLDPLWDVTMVDCWDQGWR